MTITYPKPNFDLDDTFDPNAEPSEDDLEFVDPDAVPMTPVED